MITLASKRYTLLAYAGTLDSRYPEGDGTGGGAVSWSVDSGILTADAGTGSGEIAIRWDRPTTNADASDLRDLKTFRVYVGTATGLYDVVDGVSLATTAQPGASHVKVTGLALGVTYYATVKAIDSTGNESSAATEQTFVAAAAATDPVSWTDISSLPYTISGAGDYRLASNLTQSSGDAITISTTGAVVLNLNAKTLTFSQSGAGDAIQVDTAPSSLRIYGGTVVGGNNDGYVVRFAANQTGEISVHDIDWTVCCVGDTASGFCRSSTGYANGLNYGRFFGNAGHIVTGSGAQKHCAMFVNAIKFRSYGNSLNIAIAGTQQYNGYLDTATWDYESWGNSITIAAGTEQAFHSQNYNDPGAVLSIYCHDETVDVYGTVCRIFHTDGGQKIAWLWNTVNFHQGDASNRAFSIRSAARYCHRGFNTIAMAGNQAQGVGFGSDVTTPPDGIYPTDSTAYHNTITGCIANAIEMYENQGTNYVWGNSVTLSGSGKFIGEGSSGSTATMYINSNTISGVATKAQGPTGGAWNVYDSFTSGECTSNTYVTYGGAWQGWNPASDTPSAPANLRSM